MLIFDLSFGYNNSMLLILIMSSYLPLRALIEIVIEMLCCGCQPVVIKHLRGVICHTEAMPKFYEST
jgi:hypothetical protein